VSPAFARAVDDETVRLLEATSWQSPRDYLIDCAQCARPFWSRRHHGGAPPRYCDPRCRFRAHWRRNAAYRARSLARRTAARRAAA
jgi:hypothetical protein